MRNLAKSITKSISALVFVFLLSAASLFACDIEWSIIKGEKKVYKAGDELMIKVSVHYTHRNCPEDISKTKLKTEGIKVKKATKWSQKSTGNYERKFIIIIEEDGKKELKIDATRTCDKEGGFGELTLKAK